MKNISLLPVLLLLSFASYSQCVDCKSFEDAFKKPGDAKIIKINPWQTDITLDSVPYNIGLFINLEILYLTDHPLTAIPKEIGKLQKLNELSFAGCKLEALPDEVFSLVNLKEIILLNNSFSPEYKKELKARFAKALPQTMVLL